MAIIAWPATLPNPLASSFKCGVKEHGATLQFQSGRSRVFRNRATKYELGSGYPFEQILVMDLSFRFTLFEYSIFMGFYTTYWKTFANQYANVLQFTFSGGTTFAGWVPGEISTIRNENSWEVSFSIQSDWFSATSGSDPDWQHPVAPKLPDNFKITSGVKVDRISRDIVAQDARFNLQRSIVTGDKFVKVSAECQLFDFSDVYLLFGWFANQTNFGGKPFKIPIVNFDIGEIDGAVPSFGYYGGKFLSPPTVTFRGAFGTAAIEFLAFVPMDGAMTFWTLTEILSFDDASANLTILDSQNILTTNVEIYESKGAPSWEV